MSLEKRIKGLLNVDSLRVNNISTGTSVNNLGVDASGNVVIGTTGGTDTNTFVSGGTYNTGTQEINFVGNSPETTFDVDLSSIISVDTYVTGFTFNPSTYDLTIKQNEGQPDLVSNLSVLASDVYVVSGVYNPSTGIVTYTNSSGGTFQVSGFTTGMTDSYTTAANLNGETIEFDNNIQGSNLYSVSLTPILSGKTDLTLFNTHTGDTTIHYTKSSINLSELGSTAHTHTLSEITDFNSYSGSVQTQLDNKTNLTLFNSHTGDTNNPHQTSFSNLTSTAHTHTISDITNLQTELDSKLNISDFNSYSGDVQTQLDTKIENGINSGGGNEVFSGKSGTDLYFRTLSGGSNTTISTINDIIRVDVTIPPDTNTFVTGGTYNPTTDVITLTRNDGNTIDITGVTDTFTTGGTYNDTTAIITFTKNDSTTYDVDLTSLPATDEVTIEVNSLNEISLKEVVGAPTGGTRTFDSFITITSGLTLNNLGTGTSVNNLGIDINGNVVIGTTGGTDTNTFVTGGTYTTGTLTLDRNDGNSVLVTGFLTGNTLQEVLVNGNTSGGNDIIMTEGDDVVFNYGSFANYINTNPLTANRNILFPDKDGTVALISDTTGHTENFYVTGGTYNPTTDIITLSRNDGNTIDITGVTDTFTTGGTYDNLTSLITFTKNDTTTYGVDLSSLPSTDDVTIGVNGLNQIELKEVVGAPTGGTRTFDSFITITSGLTLNNLGTGTSINNLGIDINGNIVIGTTGGTDTNTYVTGGTFSSETLTLDRNDGGSVIVTGFTSDNFYVTGFTYNDANTFTISRNGGLSDLTSTINNMTGLTVNGTLIVDTISATTINGSVSGLTLNDLDDVTTGIPTTPDNTYQGRQLYFDVTTNQWLSTEEYASLGTVTIWGKKGTAGTISKGLPVYITGFDNDIHDVELANASTGSTMPVIGFTGEDFDDNGVYPIITFGKITGVNTTSGTTTLNPNGETWDVNDELYMSTTTGGLTKFRPTGTNTKIQRIAKVLKVGTTDGQLFIFNTARTAGLPNLTFDYLWVGDGNDTPQEVIRTDVGITTTGFTYNDNNTFTITDDNGGSFSSTFNQVSGLTINGDIEMGNTSTRQIYSTGVSEISSIQYATSGTSIQMRWDGSGDSTVLSVNNTDFATLSSTKTAFGGLSYGADYSPYYTDRSLIDLGYFNSNDRYVTGFTYNDNNTFTLTRSGGLSDLTSTINTMSGLTINGNLDVNGETVLSGSGQNVLTIIGSGSTDPLFIVQGSAGELFSITDNLTGTLFAVNDVSGLPILEVNSDDEILMGNYQALSLNTTFKTSITAGLTELYTIPVSAYTGGFFEYTLTGAGARAGSIMSIFSGSSVNFTETTTTDIGDTSPVTFDMNVSGGTANLTVSATTGTWEIKTIVRSI